jgi:acetyl esterase/lipase
MRKVGFGMVLMCLFSFALAAQEVMNLYTDEIPNAKVKSVKEADPAGLIRTSITPTLQIFLPEKGNASGAGIIICPGGGYSVIVYEGEGVSTAKELVKKGIAAFVLKYRLPLDSTMVDKKTGPLQDALQAIKVVRENAKKWELDPARIGIMGFSAGGHLASTTATHYTNAVIENNNGTNLRPDFQILVYPVISMQDSLTHLGSRKKLLGENPSQESIYNFSNELQVDKNTPPAYLTHAADDKLVDVDNSITYFEKLRHHKVPVEMHIYPKGDHGFIFRKPNWMDPLFQWMKDNSLITN